MVKRNNLVTLMFGAGLVMGLPSNGISKNHQESTKEQDISSKIANTQLNLAKIGYFVMNHEKSEIKILSQWRGDESEKKFSKLSYGIPNRTRTQILVSEDLISFCNYMNNTDSYFITYDFGMDGELDVVFLKEEGYDEKNYQKANALIMGSDRRALNDELTHQINNTVQPYLQSSKILINLGDKLRIYDFDKREMGDRDFNPEAFNLNQDNLISIIMRDLNL